MTTYPVSTAPSAKAWLFGQMQAVLTADPAATFEVTYATNVDLLDSPDDQVWLGDIVNHIVQPFAMVGNEGKFAFYEQYDIEIGISIYRPGVEADSGMDAEARAWALLGAIWTIQRTDPTMGGALVTSRPNMSSSSVDWDDQDPSKGRICTLPASIHCESDI